MNKESPPGPKMEIPDKATGILRVKRALYYSMSGIASSLKHDAAFRQEMILAIILVPIAFYLPVTCLGRALMIASLFLVLIVELLNSAIELTIDYISLEAHPHAKRVKDMASGAVFFSLLNVPVVWTLVIVDGG